MKMTGCLEPRALFHWTYLIGPCIIDLGLQIKTSLRPPSQLMLGMTSVRSWRLAGAPDCRQ